MENRTQNHIRALCSLEYYELLDEVDVFTEAIARSLNEVGRNTAVAVVSRSLEYYEGILFLTTNRICYI